MDFSIDNAFDYENGFYLTCGVPRIGKFLAHLDAFRMTSHLRGEIVECGVFKGASLSRLVKLRSLLENTWSRKIVAFDSFGEFPQAGDEDKFLRDQFVAEAGGDSLGKEELLKLLTALNLTENIELVEGDICITLPEYCDTHPEMRISLANIDVDLYEPTKISIKALYPRVVPGGIILLDDYGVFPGATRAIDDFFTDKLLPMETFSYSSNLTYVRKPVDVPKIG